MSKHARELLKTLGEACSEKCLTQRNPKCLSVSKCGGYVCQWFGRCFLTLSYLDLSDLELRMMKSAKQTEQKIATLEATLLQRRDYLDSIKVGPEIK